MSDVVGAERKCVPFFFSLYESPGVQPTPIVTSLNLSTALRGKAVMPDSQMKKPRLTKLHGLLPASKGEPGLESGPAHHHHLCWLQLQLLHQSESDLGQVLHLLDLSFHTCEMVSF